MIRHTVMWKLSATEPDEKRRSVGSIRAALEPLLGVVPGLNALTVVADLADSEGNYDVILVTDHDSAADLATYQAHPDHLEAAAVVKEHVSARACVDYTV